MADVEMDDRQRALRRKGRGHNDAEQMDADGSLPIGIYDNPTGRTGTGPAPSVEGWVIIATNIHEEVDEEMVQDTFREFGDIKNMHLNLDRRTGYVKGYVLIEYAKRAEAEAAIQGLNGQVMLDQTLVVDWAFQRGPIPSRGAAGRRR